MTYLYIKAFHLIAIVTCLPRYFIYRVYLSITA